MFNRSRYRLPMSHQPAMAVPTGGSSCATCAFYSPNGGQYGSCMEPNYEIYYKTKLIPCPPESFCSDWYEVHPDIVAGC